MDFDSIFNSVGRSVGPEKELSWKSQADPAERMDEIEQKILAKEAAANVRYASESEEAAEAIAKKQREQQIDEELQRLKASVGAPKMDPAKVRLVVSEPKKLLPMLRKAGITALVRTQQKKDP